MKPLLKWLLLCIVGFGVAFSYIKFHSSKSILTSVEVREHSVKQLEIGAIKADMRRGESFQSGGQTADSEDHSKQGDGFSVKHPANQSVIWAAGRLSVQLKDRPLTWVLGNIAGQTGLEIVVATELQNATVTSSFTNLELTQGLRQLLYQWDTFFLFSNNQDQGKLRGVWIYPVGKGRAMVPFPREAQQWTGMQEFERDLMNDDPNIRIKTLETIVARFGDRAIDNIITALRDTDERVRYRALDVTLNAGIALPTNELLDLSEYDPSPPIRRLALETLAYLAEGPRNPDLDIQKLSERALSDPDPSVRKDAERLFRASRN